jgi:hypothetical protein
MLAVEAFTALKGGLQWKERYARSREKVELAEDD